MTCWIRNHALAATLFVAIASVPTGIVAGGLEPVAFIDSFDEWPHLETINDTSETVVDHELGLGALKKVRGVWRFRDSERLSGELVSRTWQVLDGFTSEEVLEELEGSLVEAGASALFACDGRGCGSGAQWANRVFKQRLLYGREDRQHYRVYSVPGTDESEEAGETQRVLIFAAARSSERQYLHLEILTPAQ